MKRARAADDLIDPLMIVGPIEPLIVAHSYVPKLMAQLVHNLEDVRGIAPDYLPPFPQANIGEPALPIPLFNQDLSRTALCEPFICNEGVCCNLCGRFERR